MPLIIKCHKRIDLGKRGLSDRLSVLDEEGRAALDFQLMCSALDDSIDYNYVQSVIDDAFKARMDSTVRIEEETEGWLYWIDSAGVTFEGLFGQGTGGHVTLNQFLVAAQMFRDYLKDPTKSEISCHMPER
jgi:hypothetical protein